MSTDEAIITVWRAAMTAACNVCINRSNRYRDDDAPDDLIYEAADCAKAIHAWMEPDEVFLSDLREMLIAARTKESNRD